MIANLMGGDGLIVLVVALVVLVGGTQLPKIARNVGLAGKEFRKAQAESEQEAAAAKAAKAAEAATGVGVSPPGVLATPASAGLPAGAGGAGLPAGAGLAGGAGLPAGAGLGGVPAAEPPVAAPVAPNDGSITLSPAQLDALLKAREEQVRGEAGK